MWPLSRHDSVGSTRIASRNVRIVRLGWQSTDPVSSRREGCFSLLPLPIVPLAITRKHAETRVGVQEHPKLEWTTSRSSV
jgi:hypothetical protein